MDKIFNKVVSTGDKSLAFDNALVKKVTGKSFSNQFDATKFDTTEKLPKSLIENDYFIVHLGLGKHRFVKGISNGYHEFEKIPPENIVDWRYRKSMLNGLDASEASILSLAFNQFILDDFLYEDITIAPKIHLPRRTKLSFSYFIDGERIDVKSLQMERDLALEWDDEITVFEAKNGEPKDFARYQLYGPYRYFYDMKEQNQIAINTVRCVYALRTEPDGSVVLKLYEYEFVDAMRPSSIRLIKCKQYVISERRR